MSLKDKENDKKSNIDDVSIALKDIAFGKRSRGKWYRRISYVLTAIVIIWMIMRMLAF